ncbi:hypothetical protein [Chromobacterium sp. ATCC 53434]|uniref:hypothetical protein n=1 Tax=Chromobacterium sp. (strain ATCC 53434 / SC 14030) TaxID=2059672 RepID=UPI0013052AB1|nr:hypothetical protein [Chromobacterium sp. ATCC 53434]
MYQLTQNGVKLIEQNLFVPQDTSNRDWCAYLEWQGQDNIPAPADHRPPPIDWNYQLTTINVPRETAPIGAVFT